jgi:hypothetical protein
MNFSEGSKSPKTQRTRRTGDNAEIAIWKRAAETMIEKVTPTAMMTIVIR